MTLHKRFLIIDKIKEKIQAIARSKGATLKIKLYYLSNNNKCMEIIRQIGTVLLGETFSSMIFIKKQQYLFTSNMLQRRKRTNVLSF